MSSEISNARWQGLYEQGDILKNAKPWEWMKAGQIFVIEDPITRNRYYCSVDSSDQWDGLGIFTGAKGLYCILGALASFKLERREGTRLVDCLPLEDVSYRCLFCNRGDLSEEAYQEIKQLGYGFRGAKQWITFQKKAGNEVPTRITTPEEVESLTLILEQVNQIVLVEKEAHLINDLLDRSFSEKIMFYWYYNSVKDQWGYRFVTVKDLIKEIPPFQCPNKKRLSKVGKLKNNGKTYKMTCTFPLAFNTMGEQLTLFILFRLQKQSGFMKWESNEEIDDDLAERFLDRLSRFFLKKGKKPAKIVTEDLVVNQILANYCKKSNIDFVYSEGKKKNSMLVNDGSYFETTDKQKPIETENFLWENDAQFKGNSSATVSDVPERLEIDENNEVLLLNLLADSVQPTKNKNQKSKSKTKKRKK